MIGRALILAAALVLLGCGGASGEDGPELLRIGWGPADVFHSLPASLVDEAADAGLGFLVTEHFPTVQSVDWRRGEMLRSFPVEARDWNRRACERGMIHVVFAGNWNVLPMRSQSDAWWHGVVDEILATYNPVCTWLEPLAEPDEGDVAKARRWTRYAAEAWPGVVILPAAGAHWTEIRHSYVDRHPGSVADAERWLSSGNPRLLVITDGGEFLPPTNVLVDLPRLAGASLTSGVPFIVYTDRFAPGDVEAHRAVIRAIGGAS